MTMLNIWGSGRLLIPVDMGRTARLGLALWSATSRKALLARWMSSICLSSLGPRLTPGRRAVAEWPMILGPEEWREMSRHIGGLVGSYEHVVSNRPPQEKRDGLALLLIGDARPAAFVKIRRKPDQGLEREAAVLEALSGGTSTMWTPRLLGTGSTDSWRYIVVEPIPWAMHAPCFQVPNELVEQYQHALEAVLGDAPQIGWVPMHGDFAPWNVRLLQNGKIAVIDWEAAAWAPVDADLVYMSATSQALSRSVSRTSISNEATTYWRSRLKQQVSLEEGDQRLRTRMLSALGDE